MRTLDSKLVVDENICDISNSWPRVSIDSDINGNALVSSIRPSVYKPCYFKVLIIDFVTVTVIVR
jgi:hypothetical protein